MTDSTRGIVDQYLAEIKNQAETQQTRAPPSESSAESKENEGKPLGKLEEARETKYSPEFTDNERNYDNEQREENNATHRKSEVGLRTGGEHARIDADTRSRVGKSIKETSRDFVRRVIQETAGNKIEEYGKYKIAYKPSASLTRTQKKLLGWGAKVNITVIPVDGAFEYNDGKLTTTNTEASVIGGRLYISSKATVAADNIIAHEHTHLLRNAKSAAYDKAYHAMIMALRKDIENSEAIKNLVNCM